ncbi:MAG: SipW-dependent-type signal peptide-containing protein [Faecalibacterium sp.]|jgi:predicted ribosomally synthesized peptide with SipW-like signal peptide|nr:SipW-dependent-type signal peptide-containing protein [Faecalibacterium sp.]
MKRNLKLIAMAALLTAALSAGMVGSTFAYFTDTASEKNNYSVASIKTEIQEGNSGLTTKKPSVKNDSEIACYVRMRYTVSPANLVTISGFYGDWKTNGTDGWYYYESAVAPNANTSPLFTTVTANKNSNAAAQTNYTEEELVSLGLRIYVESEAVPTEVYYTDNSGNQTSTTDAQTIWALYDSGKLFTASSGMATNP